MLSPGEYKKILNRNPELAGNFVNEDLAGQWISAITDHIAPWIYEQHDKGLWEIVRVFSWKRGFVKKKLTRKEFAMMVFTFCREALTAKEKATTLQTSMDHSKYIEDLKDCETLSDHEPTKLLIDKICHFFDSTIEEKAPVAPKEPTIASRMEDYLRVIVKEDPNSMPYARVCVNPDYGNDMVPSLSIEKYQAKKFLKIQQPSYIEAYVCIDGELDKQQLKALAMTYSERRDVKLYIVGQYGLRNDVYQFAVEHQIGYVFVNPQKVATPDYILPRSNSDDYTERTYANMLLGVIPMDQAIIISDDLQLTSSLADSLSSRGIPIDPKHLLTVPRLSYNEIEVMADKVTENYVKAIIDRFITICQYMNGQLYTENVQSVRVREKGHSYVKNITEKIWMDFSIDPFALSEADGLSYEYQALPGNQLGRIDLHNMNIILNKAGMGNYDRLRFTMAHEYGHYKLHAPLLQSQSISSFGDNDDTMGDMKTNRNEDKKWLERQANYFASCILMPKKLVTVLYIVLHKEFVQDVYGDKFGPIYYCERQPETYTTYNHVVGGLASMMNVSLEAMRYRLERLNLCHVGE